MLSRPCLNWFRQVADPATEKLKSTHFFFSIIITFPRKRAPPKIPWECQLPRTVQDLVSGSKNRAGRHRGPFFPLFFRRGKTDPAAPSKNDKSWPPKTNDRGCQQRIRESQKLRTPHLPLLYGTPKMGSRFRLNVNESNLGLWKSDNTMPMGPEQCSCAREG